MTDCVLCMGSVAFFFFFFFVFCCCCCRCVFLGVVFNVFERFVNDVLCDVAWFVCLCFVCLCVFCVCFVHLCLCRLCVIYSVMLYGLRCVCCVVFVCA